MRQSRHQQPPFAANTLHCPPSPAPLLYISPQKLNPISNSIRPVLCLPCQMSTWFLIGLGAFKEPLQGVLGGVTGKGKFICSWEIIKITENGKSEIVRGYKDLPKTEVFTKYPAQVHKVYRCFPLARPLWLDEVYKASQVEELPTWWTRSLCPQRPAANEFWARSVRD